MELAELDVYEQLEQMIILLKSLALKHAEQI